MNKNSVTIVIETFLTNERSCLNMNCHGKCYEYKAQLTGNRFYRCRQFPNYILPLNKKQEHDNTCARLYILKRVSSGSCRVFISYVNFFCQMLVSDVFIPKSEVYAP